MSNPLVVFLLPDRQVKGWQCPVVLPIGWKPDGTRGNPERESCEFSVVLLDDSATVPKAVHSNKNVDSPLFVLTHGGSTTENGNPEKSQCLNEWGTSRVIASFHHEWDDPRFVLITQLLKGDLSASGFVAAFANDAEAAALVEIAAICQLALLDPSLPHSRDWTDVVQHKETAALANITSGTSDRYATFVHPASGNELWQQRLDLIAKRAKDLRRH